MINKTNEEKILIALDSLDGNFARFSNRKVKEHSDILQELRTMNSYLQNISHNIWASAQK